MKKITAYILTLAMLGLPKTEANVGEPPSSRASKLEKNLVLEKSPVEYSEPTVNIESKINLEAKYLSDLEANSIIDSLYSTTRTPKYITKSEFKKIGTIESYNNVLAYNKKSKASGWYQILPSTFKEFESDSAKIFNPRKNAEVGLRILRRIEKINEKYNPYWKDSSREEKIKYIVASYNWGIGNLKDNNWDLKKAPIETQAFFKKMY